MHELLYVTDGGHAGAIRTLEYLIGSRSALGNA